MINIENIFNNNKKEEIEENKDENEININIKKIKRKIII